MQEITAGVRVKYNSNKVGLVVAVANGRDKGVYVLVIGHFPVPSDFIASWVPVRGGAVPSTPNTLGYLHRCQGGD